LGIWWGASRFQANKATEDAYKVVEAEKKILRDARNAEEKSRMTKEELIYLANQAGIKIPENF